MLGLPNAKRQLIGKDPDAGKDWGQKKKGATRGRDGWMASLTQRTWVWANSRRWWRTRQPGVLESMGLQRIRHNWATKQQPPSSAITLGLEFQQRNLKGTQTFSSSQGSHLLKCSLSLAEITLFAPPPLTNYLWGLGTRKGSFIWWASVISCISQFAHFSQIAHENPSTSLPLSPQRWLFHKQLTTQANLLLRGSSLHLAF